MGNVVVNGAVCTCMWGMAPCNLTVSSQNKVLIGGVPAAPINDCSQMNLPGFQMSTSLANPTVAAATAAALGVLTPQPCTMVPAGTWIPTKPQIMVGGKPVLTSEATLFCGFGSGTISITSPGEIKVSS